MDPVSLVVGALAAGASQGLGDAAKSAVGDVYQRLQAMLRARFAGRETAGVALAEYEQDPETWMTPLAKALDDVEIASDIEVLNLAGELMALVDPAGARTGKYMVNVSGSQGVQVGDGNVQHNTFGQ